MRQIFQIGLLSIPFLCYGQFEFEPDTSERTFPFDQFEGTALAWPNEDSIVFEIRFQVGGEFNGFLQITLDVDSVWSCRRGFLVSGEGPNIRTIDVISDIPNWDSIWCQLQTHHILDLPNQNEIVYTYSRDGKTTKVGPEQDFPEPFIHPTKNGTSYVIRLFNGTMYRRIYYYNAILLDKHFQKSGWGSMETEQFAHIAKTLMHSFSMKEVFDLNLQERTERK